MEDMLELFLFKKAHHQIIVTDAAADKLGAWNNILFEATAQIVQDCHLASILYEGFGDMRANKAGATSNQYIAHYLFSILC